MKFLNHLLSITVLFQAGISLAQTSIFPLPFPHFHQYSPHEMEITTGKKPQTHIQSPPKQRLSVRRAYRSMSVRECNCIYELRCFASSQSFGYLILPFRNVVSEKNKTGWR